MKRILFTLIPIMIVLCIQAQPEPGKVFAGGNIGIHTVGQKFKDDGTITNEEKHSNLVILPRAGYFLSERLAFGVQTGISSFVSRYPDDDPDKRSTSLFVLSPFGRYYLTAGAGGMYAELTLGLGAGKSKVFYQTGTVETNQTSLSVDIGPGVYYYITPGVALEAKIGVLGYSLNIEKDGDQKFVENEFIFNFFPSGITFGVSFTL